MNLIELNRICWACPSEWEGKTEDYRSVYIRYRYGVLRVYVSDPLGSFEDAVCKEDPDYEVAYGSRFAGFLENEEMLTILQKEISYAPSRL